MHISSFFPNIIISIHDRFISSSPIPGARCNVMVSAINIIGNDQSLQNHWLKRIIALVIDYLIFWAIGSVLTIFIFQNWLSWNIPYVWPVFVPALSGGLFFLYAFAMEAGSGGATLGKRIMDLRVISTSGPMTASKAAIRNISKIHGTFLFIDWLIGFATEGDPKQKITDRTAGTTVIVTTTLTDQQQHVYQSQQANYAPPPQEGYQRHEQTYQYPPPPPTSAPAPPQVHPGYQSSEEAKEEICNACGGRMTMTGKGRLQCIRCGKIQ